MVEYIISLPCEFTEDLVKDFMNCLGYTGDLNSLESARDSGPLRGKDKVFLFRRNTNRDTFLMVSCSDAILDGILVRCEEEIAFKVKELLLKWDNTRRKEYGEGLTEDLVNSIETNRLDMVKKLHSPPNDFFK